MPLDLELIRNHTLLAGLEVITTRDELLAFFGRLRQDSYPYGTQINGVVAKTFEIWINSSTPNAFPFFAVEDEPDDHAKNDGWGNTTLYKCLMFEDSEGEIHLFKTAIGKFAH